MERGGGGERGRGGGHQPMLPMDPPLLFFLCMNVNSSLCLMLPSFKREIKTYSRYYIIRLIYQHINQRYSSLVEAGEQFDFRGLRLDWMRLQVSLKGSTFGFNNIYVRTYIHTCMCTYKHTWIPTYLPTFLLTYLRTFLPSYLPIYVRTYIHTYLLTYLPMYLYTYIPT